MKKIINGKMYSTETAKQLAHVSSDLPGNDFNYWSERLFRTKSGNYFICGEGGARSHYGEWNGNTGSYGEQIRPYTEDEAREWAERNLDGDQYETIFGTLNDDTAVVSAAIPQSVKDAVDDYCKQHDTTITAVILSGIKSVIS